MSNPSLEAFRGQVPPELLRALDGDVSGLPNAATPVNDVGAFAAASWYYPVQAANGKKVTIGGHDFKYVTSLAAATTFTQIKIGASAAADIINLAKAINGVTSVDVVQALNPFSLAVKAIEYSLAVEMFLFAATSRGGALARVAAPSIAVSTDIAGGAEWDVTNMNQYSANGAPSTPRIHRGKFTVTPEMITFSVAVLWLPFVPKMGFVTLYEPSSFGTVVRSDKWDIEVQPATVADGAVCTFAYFFAGGVAPATQVGDEIWFLMIE